MCRPKGTCYDNETERFIWDVGCGMWASGPYERYSSLTRWTIAWGCLRWAVLIPALPCSYLLWAQTLLQWVVWLCIVYLPLLWYHSVRNGYISLTQYCIYILYHLLCIFVQISDSVFQRDLRLVPWTVSSHFQPLSDVFLSLPLLYLSTLDSITPMVSSTICYVYITVHLTGLVAAFHSRLILCLLSTKPPFDGDTFVLSRFTYEMSRYYFLNSTSCFTILI